MNKPKDTVEEKLTLARLKLRETRQRLDTREHAIIKRPPDEEDERKTNPKIVLPKS